MNRDQELRLLQGAMFIRCSTAQEAEEIIRLIDRAPTLERRKLKARPSQLAVFPAQKWKQDQFPIGTTRYPEMLLNCQEDINYVDTGVKKFGMERTWGGSTRHSSSRCDGWNEFKKSCPRDPEANGGHYK